MVLSAPSRRETPSWKCEMTEGVVRWSVAEVVTADDITVNLGKNRKLHKKSFGKVKKFHESF